MSQTSASNMPTRWQIEHHEPNTRCRCRVASFSWLVYSYAVLLRASAHVARSELDLLVHADCCRDCVPLSPDRVWASTALFVANTRVDDRATPLHFRVNHNWSLLRRAAILRRHIWNTLVARAMPTQSGGRVQSATHRRFRIRPPTCLLQ